MCFGVNTSYKGKMINNCSDYKVKAMSLNKKWVFGYYVNCSIPSKDCSSNSVEHFVIRYPNEITEIDFDTICRKTGVTDYNGVPIYENDIIEYISEDEHEKLVIKMQVIYCKEEAAYKLAELEADGTILDPIHPLLQEDVEQWEYIVVGNIHAN